MQQPDQYLEHPYLSTSHHSSKTFTVNRRILHKVAALCHASLSGSGPQYLSDLFQVYTPARCLRSSSDTHILSIPRVKTKCYGQHSFAYQGSTIWSKLLLESRHQGTIDDLKWALKPVFFYLSNHFVRYTVFVYIDKKTLYVA